MNRYDETATETKSFGESSEYRLKNNMICDDRAHFIKRLTMSGEEIKMNNQVAYEQTHRLIDETAYGSTTLQRETFSEEARVLATLIKGSQHGVAQALVEMTDRAQQGALQDILGAMPSVLVTDIFDAEEKCEINDIYAVGIVVDLFTTADEVEYQFCDENLGEDFV